MAKSVKLWFDNIKFYNTNLHMPDTGRVQIFLNMMKNSIIGHIKFCIMWEFY